MNDKTDKRKSIKKKVIGGLVMVVAVVVVMIIRGTGLKESETTEPILKDGVTDVVELDDTDEGVEPEPKEVEGTNIDERAVLTEEELDLALENAHRIASTANWEELLAETERYDTTYNLEVSDKGRILQELMWDADTLLRLEQAGGGYEEVLDGIDKLVNLNTPEMFVYGLYSLPRRYLLELSYDTLALAPSSRGDVILSNRDYMPINDEENNWNTEIDKYDILATYLDFQSLGEFDFLYVKYDVSNNGVNDEVYISKTSEEEWQLIGIYSSDEYYTDKNETVSHFLQLTQEAGKGVDRIYELEEEQYQKEKEEFLQERERLNEGD